jgi:hypothetical protein
MAQEYLNPGVAKESGSIVAEFEDGSILKIFVA